MDQLSAGWAQLGQEQRMLALGLVGAAGLAVALYLRSGPRRDRYPRLVSDFTNIDRTRDDHIAYTLLEAFDKSGEKVLMRSNMFGKVKIVFIADHEIMKEVFLANQKSSSDRWENVFVQETRGQFAVANASGQDVQARRKLILQTFRNLGLGKSQLENQVSVEAEKLVEFCATKNLENLDFADEFMRATTNIICTLVLGKRFDYGDSRMNDLFEVLKKTLSQPLPRTMAIFPFVPRIIRWMLRFRSPGLTNRVNCVKAVQEFGDSEIKEHREHPEIQGTLIRACLDLQEKQPDVFPDQTIRGILGDMLIAGSDTSSNTLDWLVLRLASEPALQERVYQEISTALQPDLSDLSMEAADTKLPVVMAFIHETMRYNPVGPATLPHLITEDIHLKCGITIPKGATAAGFILAIHWGDKRWKHPREFNINNFLTEEGTFHKPEMLVPFGIGPRSCVGEKLARLEILIFFVHMVRRFRFERIPGERYDLDRGDNQGTMNPKPYRIRAILRS